MNPASVSPPRQVALSVAGAVLLVGLLVVPIPVWGSSPWGQILQNAFHFPAFAVLLLLFYASFRHAFPKARKRALVAAILLSTAVGGASEWAQAFTTRTASREDFLLDLMGVVAGSGTIIASWLRGAQRPMLWPLTIVVAWIIPIILVSGPLVRALQAEHHQADAFPRLGDFEEDWERILWIPQGDGGDRHTEATPGFDHPSRGKRALKIEASGAAWAGVRVVIRDPLPWPSSRILCFDVFNPGTEFDLGIRVDAIDGERFSGMVRVAPGANHCRIPPDALANRHRKLSAPPSLASQAIVFHLGAPPATRTFYLDNVRLE